MLKRLAMALLVWVATLIVLSGIAQAGRSYLYCQAMGTLQAHCCCPHGSPPDAHAVLAKAPCCCEPGALPALPPSATAETPPGLPAAPLTAVLEPNHPWRHAMAAPSGYPPSAADLHRIRPPPSPAAACARLGVFLI
ncbi:hypothetical protein LZC95_05010 [Pendulispora brunnea]|uniref:Uncharacterized protein n=1 Tax=Pendulispora brunnea TaxID=2905690 RepID=A0ABZ2KC46_9BACT